MASTKARTSIWAANTLTAGAGNETSSSVNLTAGYGAQLNIKITNGATGPTVAAQCQVKVANDSGDTLLVNFGGALVAALGNNVVTSWSLEVPIGVASIQLVAGSNTGQDVVIDADISNTTGL